MGKSTISMAIFNSKLLNYQRVSLLSNQTSFLIMLSLFQGFSFTSDFLNMTWTPEASAWRWRGAMASLGTQMKMASLGGSPMVPWYTHHFSCHGGVHCRKTPPFYGIFWDPSEAGIQHFKIHKIFWCLLISCLYSHQVLTDTRLSDVCKEERQLYTFLSHKGPFSLAAGNKDIAWYTYEAWPGSRTALLMQCHFLIFPESVWAKGSSNSGGLSNIFTSSHLHITSSNLHIFTSSHPHIFTSSHLHIFSSSHPHIFTSSHLHIFTFSHLHIFTSSHLHIFSSSHLHILHILSSSHLHIFTSSHLHIFSSSHRLIFTSSQLHIFSSSHPHIFTSSHLHIFSSSHLHIFTSSHLHIFSSSHLHIFTSHLHIFTSHHIFTSSHSLLPSCSLALLLSCPLALFFSFFSISLLRRGAVPTRRHETQPFRTKRGSIAKNWGKIAILQPRRQLFRTKRASIAKNWGETCDFECAAQTLSHEMRFERQKLRSGEIALLKCRSQQFATLSHETKLWSSKSWGNTL